MKLKGCPHKGTASFSDKSEHMPVCKFCNQNLFCYVINSSQNSDLANLLDRLSSQRTTVPNRLDREATVIQFYKSNGTVSVQMSFQMAWSLSKDIADMICAIPTGFVPTAARWINSDTSNTGKNIQFNVKQNENGVWCLYLTALDNLTATDRINDSFIYQL